jgi:hypothetical protein
MLVKSMLQQVHVCIWQSILRWGLLLLAGWCGVAWAGQQVAQQLTMFVLCGVMTAVASATSVYRS